MPCRLAGGFLAAGSQLAQRGGCDGLGGLVSRLRTWVGAKGLLQLVQGRRQVMGRLVGV